MAQVSPTHAGSSSVHDIANRASEQALLDLAQHPRWRALIRHKSKRAGKTFKSDVITGDFFLSPRGRTDALAELRATLDQLSQPWGDTPDDHALCQFPARALWLSAQTGAHFGDPFAQCPAFAEWIGAGEVTTASVIFATGYLRNPGSAHGHILLHFGTSAPDRDGDLLGIGVNYGASNTENDGVLPYMVKGLLGGYTSTFTDLPFYMHDRRYREDELRDVWEYQLAVDQTEATFLAAHAWELLAKHNRYYFLRQNCAFRVAEMVDLLADDTIIPRSKAWVTPLDVFVGLSTGTRNGAPLAAPAKRHASRQTVFREGYARLAPNQKAIIDRAFSGQDPITSPAYAQLASTDQVDVTNVLLDYYAFADQEGRLDGPDAKDRQRSAVLARLALPANAGTPVRQPAPPHSGVRPSLFQVSALYNDVLGAAAEVRMRPANNDFLSQSPSAVPYSELAMGDTRVLVTDDAITLRQFELFRVTALNLSPTDSGEATPLAWALRASVESRDLSCADCLVALVEGGIGRAAKLGPLAAYAFAGGRVTGFDNDDSFVQAGGHLGVLYQSRMVSTQAEIGAMNQIDGDNAVLPFGRFEARLGGSQHWNIRLGVEHREAFESRIAAAFYW